MSKYFKIQEDSDKQSKQNSWDVAIGLQEVDGLKPSDYLIQVAKSHIEGKLSYKEVQKLLYQKYENQSEEPTNRQKECDIVSARMAEYLLNHSFRFSPLELSLIHKHLFEGIVLDQDKRDVSGQYRPYNITKEEPILNNLSVTYGDYRTIQDYLEYDFNEQKRFIFTQDPKQVIHNLANFTSNIWQIHPFREGNTRTVALFIQCYLKDIGFHVDNSIFIENSQYFRNSLVRANYANYAKSIQSDITGLEAFFENMLFGGNHELSNRNLMVDKLFIDTQEQSSENQEEDRFDPANEDYLQ